MDSVIEIESARMRLGIKKQDLCKAARLTPEMYSYLLKRGRQGHELPEDCLAKIRKAIAELERELEKKNERLAARIRKALQKLEEKAS